MSTETNQPRGDTMTDDQHHDDPIDPEELRNGGPTRTGGIRTTTGSQFGPGGPGKHTVPTGTDPDTDDGAGTPTTTGDATTGGQGTPVRTTTSDASTAAASAGGFTED